MVGIDSERADLGPGRGAAGAELEATVGNQIECSRALRDAGRMVHLRKRDGDALPDVDSFGAGRRSGQKNLGRRRVRVLLEKMMLDFPNLVEAELVGEFDLLEGLMIGAQFRVAAPGLLY